ncbi:MAG: (Na+)-NQR maturation NqrM [Pseudomonadota bacterium]|nr:(Na+)-NQR maturation NqrM [Pseudomonadota bacterium]
MAEFIIAFIVFCAVLLAMSLGVLVGRSAIGGSCGGLSALPGIRSDCGGACRRECPRSRRSRRDLSHITDTRTA